MHSGCLSDQSDHGKQTQVWAAICGPQGYAPTILTCFSRRAECGRNAGSGSLVSGADLLAVGAQGHGNPPLGVGCQGVATLGQAHSTGGKEAGAGLNREQSVGEGETQGGGGAMSGLVGDVSSPREAELCCWHWPHSSKPPAPCLLGSWPPSCCRAAPRDGLGQQHAGAGILPPGFLSGPWGLAAPLVNYGSIAGDDT